RVARSRRSLANPKALPLGLPDTRPRSPLSPARAVRVARSRRSLANPRALPHRTPRHAPSLAAVVGSLRARGSLAALAREPEGVAPSDSPTRARARRCRRLAPCAWLARGARSRTRGRCPIGLPDTRPRSPLSPARSVRVARSRRSLANPRALPHRTPRHAPALAAVADSLRARGSLAALAREPEGVAPSDSPTRALARRCRRLAPCAWLARGARSRTRGRCPIGLPDTRPRSPL